MRKLRKYVSFIIATALIFSCSFITPKAAYEGEEMVVIGADLSDSQISTVYDYFGIDRGSVDELSVTNTEEREYLEGLVSDSVIGTHSISCVYIKILDEGAGLDISINNINGCTENVYENVLLTAGIYDAKVIIAAPFEVSGTAALTGIYKAFEAITGQPLSEEAKQAATEELVLTSELADQIGDADATVVVNELKMMLDEISTMTDEELEEAIRTIAENNNVSLTDGQVQQLISLARSLEKLDASQLMDKVQNLQESLKNLSSTGEKVSAFFQKVGNFFSSIGDFFKNLFS